MTMTACPPRPCARAACKKSLYRRAFEKPFRFHARKFCCQECRLKCRKWGRYSELERSVVAL